jgi:hypothetical protein
MYCKIDIISCSSSLPSRRESSQAKEKNSNKRMDTKRKEKEN